MNKTLFILGGTGFIGHEVIIQAVQAGWRAPCGGRYLPARDVERLSFGVQGRSPALYPYSSKS